MGSSTLACICEKKESVHGDGEALIAWTNVNVFKVAIEPISAC